MNKSKTCDISIISNLTDLKGIGPKKSQLYSKLGLNKLSDIFCYYPRSYEDLRNPCFISECETDNTYLIIAKVLLVNFGRGFGKKRTVHLLIEDKSGRAEVLFFGSSYIASNFKIGEIYYFHGKVKAQNGRITIFHPEYGLYSDAKKGILPLYHLTKGLTQKDLRIVSRQAIDHKLEIIDILPNAIKKYANVCDISFAYENIHYPLDEESYKKARYRLIFDELFKLKYAMNMLSCEKISNAGFSINSNGYKKVYDILPYSLTNAQNKAINEIISDLRSNKPMNRLLQGDVGCGKTAVAIAAILEASFAGYQSVFMAPTDILATQHFNSLKPLFSKLGFECELLTSSVSFKERKEIELRIASGECKVIIGTHAVFQESVKYNNLGLIITDEQHRFGVLQREKLSSKSLYPNVLIMSATPIPRTLAAILYADMDISTIDELPKGRKEIKTSSYSKIDRINAYKLLFEQIKLGKQCYIVAPFISESENSDGYCVENLYNSFIKKHPDISCAMLTGELSKEVRDDIMQRFLKGDISVLISTVIIEVGIDVSNATVMLIENAERFGLSQLHQLRGRVGRGKDESYCLLCYDEPTEIGKKRIETLCRSNDGFKIAEMDLELRGPGEILGYRQHGIPQLCLADPIKHSQILKKACDAIEFMNNNPNLVSAEEKDILDLNVASEYLNTSQFVL